MMRFIKNPNLPEGRVSRIICGEIPFESLKILKERNIEIIKCQNNKLIDSAISSHADMCALHLGGNRIIIDRNQNELINKLRTSGFDVTKTDEAVKGEYPGDIKLNVALFGKNAVGAFGYSDLNVINNLADYNKYKVKQGYAKCSLLPINETAVITDDESIYKTLKNSFDTLLISKGDIFLEGHKYGFIGGAAAKISEDEIFFFGDIRKHKNYNEIISFLTKYSCDAIYSENSLLCDVGGIVSLCEYN